ncbi:MAG: nucleotidyl transferase AbiEii/AbiGii toxin family protein [Caldisericia bacterium]
MELNRNHKNIISKIENFINDNNFYLAGGTAVYYYLKHRKSEDLDFFTNSECDFTKKSNFLKDYEISLIKKDTLYLIINNVKLLFFYYPYSLLCQKNKINNIYIANLIDILLMKILALIQRGSKKDFIDIYFIIKEERIKKEELYPLFIKKFVNTIN